MRPARLLAGLERYPAPAFQAFRGCAFQTTLAAGRLHWDDFGDAQFRSFLDNPFEVIELDQGRVQHDSGGRRRRGKFFERPEDYALLAGSFDLGEKNASIVGDFEALACLDAQDASQMPGLLARNLGVSVAD